MPKLIPITQTEFSEKRWHRPAGFTHAIKYTLAPLVVRELTIAAVSLPIGIMVKENALIPVAIQGVPTGKNMMVSPDGKWQPGYYIPAAYRGYPFSLVKNEEGKLILCIDEDSGLISDTAGERFFDENGDVSEAVKNILNFLQQIHQNRLLTERICGSIQQYDLIEPWSNTLRTPNGEQQIKGLFRISERKLNKLDDDSFIALRKAGALPLIYCQLLSMQNMAGLIKLAGARQSETGPGAENLPDISSMFGNDNDIFRFDMS